MDFDLDDGVAVLERTPATLRTLLSGLPTNWTDSNEGESTWSPFDVVGHLIHGEKTDWIPRARIILAQGASRRFEPFDRFAQFEASRGKSLHELLDEFAVLRAGNLEILREMPLSATTLAREGEHPDFGSVTLRQLLATWVVHDLNHLGQISRVMAKQYANEVGPWKEFLPILTR